MKKIILATSNSGKVKEIEKILSQFDVIAYSNIIESIEIKENGSSFKENAIIKSQEIYRLLNDKSATVLSDDSGISIEALNGEPHIYSARYAGVDASDRDNLNKVCQKLKEQNINISPAYYTAAIAITSSKGTVCTHGWMHGSVVSKPRGSGGFGYDPIFIPLGYSQSLGELDDVLKGKLSHRYKALILAKNFL